MSYVKNVLRPGEAILYETKISWTTYAPGGLMLVLAVIVFVLMNGFFPSASWAADFVPFLLLVASLVILLAAWFERWTTEIAVTNMRIILKRGFIRRHTIEMNMDKVESVDVDQSLLGRLFNYGDITVRGVGTGFEPLRMVDNPLKFRSQVSVG